MLSNKYRELVDFVAAHDITLPRNEDWRLCERLIGQINGLPESQGVLAATNGIDCYIELDDGKLFLGHLHWFITDKRESVRFNHKTEKVEKFSNRSTKANWLIEDLL